MLQTNFNHLADFIFEMGTLRNMRRMHTQVIPNSNDTIASHSFRTAMIGYSLAELENADKNKVLKMALFHDMPESRIGDRNFIHKFYTQAEEQKAYTDQTANVPNGMEIASLLQEFNSKTTKEAIVVHDADTLDQMFLEKEVLEEKPEDFAKWHEFSAKKLNTESAKRLAEAIIKRNPMQWFFNFDEGLKKE